MNIKIPDQISSKVQELLDKIDEKNIYYVFAAALVFVFLIDYLVLMRPQLNTLSKLNPKIEILSDDITKTKDDIARIDQYKAQVVELEASVSNVELKVNSRNEVPLILEYISRAADKYGVQIDQIMPNTQDQELVLEGSHRTYYALPIFIEATTGYHNFGRFLGEIETGDIYLDAVSFTIASVGESSLHRAKMTLEAVVYEDSKKKQVGGEQKK